MGFKLWKICFHSKKYSGEYDECIIQSSNIVRAIIKAVRIFEKYKLTEVESVEYLGDAK